ncbi:MAG: helicase-exonuclease AddAB subunit AddA [Eubacteriales bacterium]|nr:helicase-exonuclease AddAB subunit AddA [Eubacteriales bacterium]
MSDDRKWTNEQIEAIEARDCNLLVSAAAGAGKTAVLVERIISLIADVKKPADIDRLLVMTFTNAAAYEMKQRIADRIIEELQKNPDSSSLQTQLTLLNNANIKTIHSFCLDVVKSNFSKIDIDPNFRVAEQAEIELMKSEAIGELFDGRYEDENDDRGFIKLLDTFGDSKNDIRLQKVVLDIYNFVQSLPWPQEWLEQKIQMYDFKGCSDFGKTGWGLAVLDTAKSELEEIKENLDCAIKKFKNVPGFEKYYAVLEKDRSKAGVLLDILKLKNVDIWDAIVSELSGIEFERLPPYKKNFDLKVKDEVSELHQEFKKAIEKIRKAGLSYSSETLTDNFGTMYTALSHLAEMVNDFTKLFSDIKNKKAVLDFSDLEHYCLKILTDKDENGQKGPSDAALEYRSKFAAVLIDEYQDSNLVQEEIIRMVSRADEEKPNLFMVGDVKQSIYRFRHADPNIFMEKYKNYPENKGVRNRKILLSKNFRSRSEILDAVNFIFRQIMSERVGELNYTDEEILRTGASYPQYEIGNSYAGGITELHLIDTKRGSKENTSETESEKYNQNEEETIPGDLAGDDEEERLDSVQCEAKMIGSLIKDLLKPDGDGKYFNVFDNAKGKYRRAQYRDIVVLSRSTAGRANIWADELNAMDIPAFTDAGTGFFSAIEVQIVLSLLRIIDNPLQDIPLLSVLRSPIYAFTSDELALLRLEDRKVPLYEALVKLAGKKEDLPKASLFVENLERWRRLSVYMPTDQLLWQLYNETGYFEMASAMPAGEQRRANLRILFEKARQYEETSYKGLFSFVNFMDKLIESEGDLGSAKILGENDNVVRIMSIHKSKGLEFPVVFLSGCGTKFNLKDLNGTILINKEMGFGIDAIDPERRVIYASPQKEAVKEINRVETLSEEMRILYVGMTRAREKLFITGVADKSGNKAEKWKKTGQKNDGRISPYEIQKASTYLDWIMPAIIKCGSGEDSSQKSAETDEIPSLSPKDESICKIRIWGKEDLKSKKRLKEKPVDENFAGPVPQDPLSEEITDKNGRDAENLQTVKMVNNILGWIYPNIRAASVPAKITVSELKRMSQISEDDGEIAYQEYSSPIIRKPSFLEGKKGLSAVEKGIVMHFIMQHLDYLDPDLEKQVESMVKKDLLSPEQAKSADLKMLRGFLHSDLGKRMLSSSSINREIPFNIEISWSKLFKEIPAETPDNEMILLQGVIDCYFTEDDGIVLVDYKTDYVPPEGSGAIKGKYKVQMEYYAYALETLTGKRVKNKYIFLFRTGEILEY